MEKNKVEKEYLFSVVMVVYNTVQYLREAINSLLCQTIGFENIQLVLVDYGSTDGSDEICANYLEQHTDNIILVHKEKGSISAARNTGLSYAKGQYICFMDSDDKVDHDALEKVLDFWEKHDDETDVITLPVKHVGSVNSDHYINEIFNTECDIIELRNYTNRINLCAASFIKTNAIGDIRFDERLAGLELSKFIIRVLLKKMKLGFVKNTNYWLREGNETKKKVSNYTSNDKEWYINTIVHFSNDVIQLSLEYCGTVPRFVQYEIMSDLIARWKQGRIPREILSSEERNEYINSLKNIIKWIDDEVIIRQDRLDDRYKTYLLFNKYGEYPKFSKSCIEKNDIDEKNNRLENGSFTLSYGKSAVLQPKKIEACFDFLVISDGESVITIEGYYDLGFIRTEGIKPVLMINNTVYNCETVDRTVNCSKVLDSVLEDKIGFRLKLPIPISNCSVSPALIVEGMLIPVHSLRFGTHFPVSNVYKYSYACSKSYIITTIENAVRIEKKPRKISVGKRELLLLNEIWKKRYPGGRKAFVGRICYHTVNAFKRKDLWLLSDRVNKADDNGEAMFRYVIKSKPKGVKAVFALSKKSNDYARIRKIGKCIDSMSLYHKLIYLISDVTISSHTYEMFTGHNDAVRDILWQKQIVFIPHGITKEDVSNYFNKYRQNFAGFITVSSMERDSIIKGNYGYSEKQVWLTGHSRYDYLYHAEKNVITLMPTWRRYLFKGYQETTGLWDIKDHFEQTEYFGFYNSLLSSRRLLSFLSENGYTLQFMPHPNMQRYSERFYHNENVVFLPIDTIYRDVLAESKMIITDYSAAVFDFAYLRKPVVYCQFDKEEYYSKHLIQGYFSYEDNGFGEVTYNIEELIDLIIEYVKNGCKLKEKYRKRINDFFAFADQNNCKRILDSVVSMRT